ncbi:sodium-coupled monocarboxylate transporter 2-like isoform X1 [Mya arenaria]|uniref:sodium-coupled monocarboxylate transporter 2-like isoform X1 n=1 Tax=Mya arenaria TaxID=6604 RepID=UPI0022E63613|nr:sodium-coupled monocarboxylate transporter 2-like isoform X1 [Mya arenaria]
MNSIDDPKFHVLDYVIMVLFLVISSAIGIYYGFYKKQTTPEEYLLGGRQMNLLPVAMSLVVTYQSAVSVLGIPMEHYVYTTMSDYLWVAIMADNAIQALLLVPLFYPLRLTSTYEYFGRRFKSRAVQLLGTIMGMLQTLLYMAIVLLAPALALEAVAGIPLWLSVVMVGIIGTFYTSIGGLRTVIWTDVFQFIILYGGLLVILILGINKVGGMKRMGEIAIAGGRVNFSIIDPDPRVRHTVWGLLIGGIFNWLPNCCNQSAVQRICSMKSIRDAKISCLLNIPFLVIYGVLLALVGLLLYAYFTLEQCDPYLSGAISNNNQLVPYFVMRVFRNVPGLAGLFIAALFSGALSSLSSGINSMSANTLQDLLIDVLKDAQQYKKTMIAKLVVLVYGALAVGLAYLARSLTGPITQIGVTAMGATGGPMVGIIFLGATFPQANWIGAFAGGIIGIVVNMWVALGSFLYGAKAPTSLPVSIEGCLTKNLTSMSAFNLTNTLATVTNFTTTERVQEGTHLAIYDISYMYFGLLGFMVTFICGLAISMCTGMDREDPTEEEYIFPCLRGFWKIGYTKTSNQPVDAAEMSKTDVQLENTVPVENLEIEVYHDKTIVK